MQRRQFLLTAASTISASLAPGLRLPARAADTSRTLKFIPQADLAILDPIGTTAYVTRNHALMVYDTLFGVDEQYKPHPQMLESAVVENDGKLWRLTLRAGLRFHDNEPVLGKDVVASIKRWGKRDIYGGALDGCRGRTQRDFRSRGRISSFEAVSFAAQRARQAHFVSSSHHA